MGDPQHAYMTNGDEWVYCGVFSGSPTTSHNHFHLWTGSVWITVKGKSHIWEANGPAPTGLATEHLPCQILTNPPLQGCIRRGGEAVGDLKGGRGGGGGLAGTPLLGSLYGPCRRWAKIL